MWPEIEFGHILSIECPYGLTSNKTILAAEPTLPLPRLRYSHLFEWYENIFFAPRYKRSFAPVKSSTLVNEREYNSASGSGITKTKRMKFIEKHLRHSNNGTAHAVRTCLLSNGTAVWGDVIDELCKEEVRNILLPFS